MSSIGTSTETPDRASNLYSDQIPDENEEDDLLLAENESLRVRVAELEKTVHRQQSEMMLLQTTSADLLRRIAKLELTSGQSNGVAGGSVKGFMKPRLPPKNVSLSSYNVSKTTSPSRNGLSRSMYTSKSPEARTEETDDSLSSLKGLSNTLVNVSVGKSSRGSPLRKWMSHQNVKGSPSSLNLLSESTTSGRTTPSLVSASPHQSTWTVPRSISRAASASTLYTSPRRRSNSGCNSREPIFNASSHALQLQVAGRSVTVPVPSSVEKLEPCTEQSLPDRHPRLEWAYGYRGKDARNNVHYLPTGELLYFSGSVVVLHNLEENTQRHYLGHTSDIRSVCIHPNRVLIASGQSSRHQRERHPDIELRDPYVNALDLEADLENALTEAHVRIWDSVTLSTLNVLSGSKAMFEKALVCLAFSTTDGGNLLACVDDSYQHTLSVWKWAEETKIAESKGANDQVFSIGWHPSLRSLLVMCGKGHFSFWVLNQGTLSRNSANFEAAAHTPNSRGREKSKTILSMCFSDTGDVVTGDSNGTLALWDPVTYKSKKQAHAVHQGGIFALALSKKGTLLSAGKDRTIAEWETADLVRRRRPAELPDDAGTPRIIVNIDSNKIVVGTSRNTIFIGDFESGFNELVDGDAEDVTYCVAVPPTRFVTTSADGCLRLYNTLTKEREWRKNIGDGITCASANPEGLLLAIGFATGSWSVLDLLSQDIVFEQKESNQPITAIQFSPNGVHLFVATKDLAAVIYRMDSPQRFHQIARIGALSSFAISPDWDMDSQYIRANSTVGHIYHWLAATGELVDHASVRDVEWESCNCRISYEAGYLAHSVEGITMVTRSPSKNVLAIGRDNGSVRLYNCPVQSTKVGFHALAGHAHAISGLTYVGSDLITAAVSESSLFQWQS